MERDKIFYFIFSNIAPKTNQLKTAVSLHLTLPPVFYVSIIIIFQNAQNITFGNLSCGYKLDMRQEQHENCICLIKSERSVYYSCRNHVSPSWRQGLSSDGMDFMRLLLWIFHKVLNTTWFCHALLCYTWELHVDTCCSVYIYIYTVSLEIMLDCHFWILRYKTSILHIQRVSQTLVSGALQSHTEVEALLPLF